MKGFYVSRQNSGNNLLHQKTKSNVVVNAGHQPAYTVLHTTVIPGPPIVSAGVEAGLLLPPSGKRKNTSADTCDLIFFRNGTEVRAQVKEISAETVKYNDCNLPGGPLFVSLRSEILLIRYANGQKEIFDQQPPDPELATVVPERHPKAATVYVLAILGWYPGIGSIPALIIGYNVLRDMQANPGKYRGENGIWVAIVFSWLKVLLLAGIAVLLVLTL